MGQVAGIFPGQGSERAGMIEPLKRNDFVADIFGDVGKTLGREFPVSPSDPAQLERNLDIQLSVFCVSACYYRMLDGRYRYRAFAGHSLGFYSALYAAGALGIEDCARMIVEAHRAIEEVADGGKWAMAAIIGLRAEDCSRVCREIEEVHVSNVNSTSQVLVSGRSHAVEEAMQALKGAGALDCRLLGIPYPLHSPFMVGIRDLLMPVVRSMEIREPSVPVVDHTGGGALSSREGIAEVLAGQLERPVLWRDAVRLLWESGIGTFLEIGPSSVLSKLVRWIVRDAEVLAAEEALEGNGLPSGPAGRFNPSGI